MRQGGDGVKLKFNRTSKLWLVGFGIYEPNQIIDIKDKSKANEMLKTGYFKEIKKRKSKKKGDVLNANRD